MHDTVIRGGIICDGSGSTPFEADLAISGEMIVEVGRPSSEAKRVIDARGKVISPGFVDIHSHSDYYLLIDPLAQSKIRQGVTTEVIGNCGYSAAPIWGDILAERKEEYEKVYDIKIDWNTLEGYSRRIARRGTSVNIAPLVGHNTIRASVMGSEDRAPTTQEMEGMKGALKDAFAHGCFGLSTGLIYPPSIFSDTGELVELGRVVAEHGGFFAFHMRSESDLLIEAVEEVLRVGRESGAGLQISHLKASGEGNWRKLDGVLKMIEDARSEGVRLACDRYPYTASNTTLQALLPDWALDGSKEERMRRLRDGAVRERIKGEMKGELLSDDYWDRVIISEVVREENRAYEGKSVRVGASIRRCGEADFIMDLLLEEELMVSIILFSMSEENLRKILTKPYVMIGSDAGARSHEGPLSRGRPHPRGFGAFPRVLGKHVRDEKLLDLPTAIWKMTALPSRKAGIERRGLLRPGHFADIVIFDPETVRDEADYESPHRYPQGIELVMVNGVITAEGGQHTLSKAGKVLKKGGTV